MIGTYVKLHGNSISWKINKFQFLKLNCKLYINPDGHEWQRSKWNSLIKKYWKMSERLMVKQADLLICDSKNIENYIQEKIGGTNND